MSDRIKPWQRKAIGRGRTPLPDAPGHRPWLKKDINIDTSEAGASNKESSSGSQTGSEVSFKVEESPRKTLKDV
ncbi:uncharacterized protein BKA55DRAFT_566370 [Fusarium redolens]|uniref:Uncharacterized protein n=1 Tax=Fusarium redolens TaxID=48865 RepID=A0A9P9K926_FUSRE|nr:uncharacterized protein BKA55DRAFT_566370 [Fusarium redolens]KAH7253857.1 hypothetical protein BKA55DRAFT_566370 [Fusarium redolens]